MKQLLLSLLLLVISAGARALEVDERLTLRVLKTSDTRKTILINRGTEDGLVEGNHAKFFVSAGVVARGVCIKASPSRSVWSIYRLVNADFVLNDAVMNLKISPPVKITQDESKMVVEEDVPNTTGANPSNDPATLGIPLAEGAQDLPPGVAPGTEMVSREELAALRALGPGHIRDRDFEIWTALHFSALSSKSSSSGNGTGGGSYDGSETQTHFTLGGEIYSKQEREWWARFSTFGMVNFQRKGALSFQGNENDESVTEFGGGLNWHPWDVPSVINDFIPFFTASLAFGSAFSKIDTANSTTSREARGSTFSRALGVGFKFYTQQGFGARAILDYYMRDDKLKESEANITWNRSNVGPRLWVGLSYRW